MTWEGNQGSRDLTGLSIEGCPPLDAAGLENIDQQITVMSMLNP